MRNTQYQPVQYREDRLVVPYYDFAGGIFDTENADRLVDNEVSYMENLDIKSDGSLKMRKGFVQSELTLADKFDGNNNYSYITVYDKGNSYEIIGLYKGNLVKIPSNEILATGYPDKVAMCQYKTKLYILGGGHFRVYDGSTVSEVTVPEGTLTPEEIAANDLDFVKDGTIMSIAQGKIIISGIPSEPNSVYYSARNMPYFFDSTDASDILEPTQEDNDRVTAIVEYSSGILVFKRNSVYMVSNNLGYNEEVFRINIPTGTVAPRTITRFDNFLGFLGSDNKVYGIYGGSYYYMNRDRVQTYCLSDNIENHLSGLSQEENSMSTAIYYGGKYMLAIHHRVDENTFNTVVYNMYTLGRDSQGIIQSQSWGVYTGIDIAEFIPVPGVDLYMAGLYTTRIYKFMTGDIALDSDIHSRTYTAEQAPYDVYIKFKQFNFDTPEHFKIFRAGWIQFSKILRAEFVYFNHNIYIEDVKVYLPYIDDRGIDNFIKPESDWSNELTGVNWDEFFWSSEKNPSYYFRINAKGRSVQNELKFKTIGKRISILGSTFEYKLKQPQRNIFNTNFQRGN